MYRKMAVRERIERGRFAKREHEPRKNRMLCLSDRAWDRLQKMAEEKGVFRSDLVESIALDSQGQGSQDESRDPLLSQIESIIGQILQDPSLVRSKDRSAVRKAMRALLATLSTDA